MPYIYLHFTELKAHTLLDISPEILHFYGIVLKTLDKPINLNLDVLD